jgi:hypothetical protein
VELRQKRQIVLRNLVEKPLTEQQIVEATVAYANGARLTIEQSGALEGIVYSMNGEQIEDAERFRSHVRLDLEKMITDPHAVAVKLIQMEGHWPAHQIMRTVRRVPGGVQLVIQERFDSVSALVSLGVLFLLDVSRGYRQKLCQCGWAPCGRFFFETRPPRGRPQRKYCRRSHLDLTHNHKATERMQSNRDRRLRK